MKTVLQLNLKRKKKLVHAFVRSKLVVKDSVKILKNDEDDLIMNKVDIEKILNGHFHSIFEKEQILSHQILPKVPN